MNIKEQLEQWINDSAYRRAIRQSSTGLKSLDEALQWHIRVGYEDGANEMKELLLIAVNALEVVANRKECNHYECCASCGPIYECEEALEQIQEKIKGE